MRLNDNAIKTVAYLGTGGDEAFDPAGTCFFVSVSGATAKQHVYLVTADHVARTIEEGGFDVRLTRKDSGLAQCHRIEEAKWIRHPTEPGKVDLALLEFRPPPWSAIHVFPRKGFLSDFKMGTKSIGPGDLAYVVGLFNPIYGKTRNLAAVNTGHIAMIPTDEQLAVVNWLARKPGDPESVEVEAYLVQVQNTLPGISGAPVYVRRSLEWKHRNGFLQGAEQDGLEAWTHGSLWLLGVWTDGWFNNDLALRAPKGGKVHIPAGMGAVVPVRKLIEILNCRELAEKRGALA